MQQGQHERTQKRDVHELYIEYVVNVQPDEREKGKLTLHQQRSFITLITTVSTAKRLPDYVVHVLDAVTVWEPSELAQAFDTLETYALNLLDYPWKRELRIILTYSGFYKTRLEPYIKDAHRLLGVLGYEPTSDHKLELSSVGPYNKQKLTGAACDFFLAAVECRTISSIVSSSTQSAKQIYEYRRNNAGDLYRCVMELQARTSQEVSTVLHDESHFELFRDADVVVSDVEPKAEYLRHHKELSGLVFNRPYVFQGETKNRGALIDGNNIDWEVPVSNRNSVMIDRRRLLHGVDTTDSLQRAADALVPSMQQARQHQMWRLPAAMSSDCDAQSNQVDTLAAMLMNVTPSHMNDAGTRRDVIARIRSEVSGDSHRLSRHSDL